jgi:hypothetical protein
MQTFSSLAQLAQASTERVAQVMLQTTRRMRIANTLAEQTVKVPTQLQCARLSSARLKPQRSPSNA